MSEKQLSKYAAKKKRQAEQAARADRTLSAINVAVRITERKAPPSVGALPKISAGPHPTPPRRNMEIGDLGDLPHQCADALARAANLLSFAETVANRMVEASASPYQTAEPRGIAQFCLSTRLKVAAMAPRAEAVPSRRATE